MVVLLWSAAGLTAALAFAFGQDKHQKSKRAKAPPEDRGTKFRETAVHTTSNAARH